MHQLVRIKVLVMHEEHIVEAGLKATLAGQASHELVAQDAPNAIDSGSLAWFIEHGVDVAITDYDRGLALAKAMQRAQQQSRPRPLSTVIVTSRTTQAEIRTALKHGVNGYLTTSSPANEIVDAVRKVHAKIRHVSEPLAHYLLEGMLDEQLTPRESEVLRLAAQGLANKVIAVRMGIELGTVKCHMKSVMDKLQARNRTDAVVIANQRGLLTLGRTRSGVGTKSDPYQENWVQRSNGPIGFASSCS